MSGIAKEQAAPFHRYDVIRSLAANGEVVVAGLDDGAVAVSRDGAQTWERDSVPNASMIALDTCPDGSFVGLDFYHRIWNAAPDAKSWQSEPLESQALAIDCAPDGRIWTVGSFSTIQVSSDKGKTWQTTDFGEDFQFTSVQFIDEQFGVAIGEFGVVYVTHDNGKTWEAKGPTPNEAYAYDGYFASSSEGWISGIGGLILHTSDGGTTWQVQENQTKTPLYRLVTVEGKLYGVGARGVIAQLTGDAWTAVPYENQMPLELEAATPLTGTQKLVVGGIGGLVRTVDSSAN